MAILLSLLLSLDMDGCHISDPHIPMRTLYACVYCVPGCPLCPHPLTRLCVWRLLPARLLTDPGLPGSMGIPGCAFHTPPRAGKAVESLAVAQSLRVRIAPLQSVTKPAPQRVRL